MADQNWKPVVLRKNPPKPSGSGGSGGATTGAFATTKKYDGTGVNVRKLEQDDPNYKIPTITREMAQQIIQGRAKLKLTQEQLAQKCNLPAAVIKEYERGGAVYNRKILDPICRVLDIKISKPK